MPQTQHDIFLSYASSDRERVLPLVEVFESMGWKVWWDTSIPHGKRYDFYIEEQLENSKTVVVVWSEKSVKSKWVRAEATDGDDRGILIPLQIDQTRIPLAFRMIQTANLIGWQKGQKNSELDKLLNQVKRFLPLTKGNATPLPVEAPKPTPTIITPPKPKLILPHHEMIKVQGGTFMMGSENGRNNEKPIHQVTLSDFYIAKYPVTQALWKAIMGNNPSHFKGDKLPVEQVSWDDCQEFIKKLNEKTEEKYRLSTEAEWEFAARGGSQSKGCEYSGGNDLKEVGWFKDNSDRKTHPVGQKRANELGIYEMSGNVWEWCADWFGDYSVKVKNNPRGSEQGKFRVLRGGSWNGNNGLCRVSSRGYIDPYIRDYVIGFRVARH